MFVEAYNYHYYLKNFIVNFEHIVSFCFNLRTFNKRIIYSLQVSPKTIFDSDVTAKFWPYLSKLDFYIGMIDNAGVSLD